MPRMMYFLMAMPSVVLAQTQTMTFSAPGLVISIAPESTMKDKQPSSSRQRWVYQQDQVFQSARYRVGEYLILTDCIKGVRANAEITLYDDAGAIVYSRKAPVFGFAPPMPGSVPAKVQAMICANQSP